jgi:hypothetical protein
MSATDTPVTEPASDGGILGADLGRELAASALLMVLSFATAGVLVGAALGILWLFA